MSFPNDNRLGHAWDRWRTNYIEEHPGLAVHELSDAFRPFVDGWQARMAAASSSSIADDLKIMRDQAELLEREYHRAFSMLWESHARENASRRLVDAFRQQIIALKSDPLDAPAYKRIANQRREIKRLMIENAVLRDGLARGVVTSGASDD